MCEGDGGRGGLVKRLDGDVFVDDLVVVGIVAAGANFSVGSIFVPAGRVGDFKTKIFVLTFFKSTTINAVFSPSIGGFINFDNDDGKVFRNGVFVMVVGSSLGSFGIADGIKNHHFVRVIAIPFHGTVGRNEIKEELGSFATSEVDGGFLRSKTVGGNFDGIVAWLEAFDTLSLVGFIANFDFSEGWSDGDIEGGGAFSVLDEEDNSTNDKNDESNYSTNDGDLDVALVLIGLSFIVGGWCGWHSV